MKRIIAIILLALLCMAVFGTPAIISSNRVSLTDEQIAAYNKTVAERPDDYSYNPMHLGDRWWFEYDWYDPTIPSYTIIAREVRDSTQIDSTAFYEVYGVYGTPGLGYWIKNVGDSVIVWEQNDYTNDIDGDSLTTWVVSEDFTITTTDPENPVWLWSHPRMHMMYGCYLVETGWINYFGENVQYRMYNYTPEIGDLFYTLVWVRGFGVVYLGAEECDVNMVGCIINGVSYGITDVDDVTHPIDDGNIAIEPNPFVRETTIGFTTNKAGNASCRIYNIKGQLVKTIVNRNITKGYHTYVWDGRDDNGQPVVPGIYFSRINCGKMHSVKKMMLMK